MAALDMSLVSEEHRHIYKMLVEIFEESLDIANFTELVQNLNVLFDSFHEQGFEESMTGILKEIIAEPKRTREVRKLFRFISECAVVMDNKFKEEHLKKNGGGEDADVIHPFMKFIFDTLKEWSEASTTIVRIHSCELLNTLLTYVQDHGVGEIDLASYETISKIIELSKLDISCSVRAQAVLIAKYFQDPSNVNDPIIEALCWQVQMDPSAQVRQNIVSIIAACEETMIPVTRRFLCDVHPRVRNAALLHICSRISPRSYTKYQRIMILHQCFTDSSATVRQTAVQKLIPVWFRAYDDKLCSFLKNLRCGDNVLDNLPFINELMTVLSKCIKVSQLIKEIDLDEESHLPKSELDAEQVFIWRYFYDIACRDARFEKLVPPHNVLLDYISKYIVNPARNDDHYIAFNEMVLFWMDIVEAMEKRQRVEIFDQILNVIKNPFIPHQSMPFLVTMYLQLSPKEKSTILSDLIDIINDFQKFMLLSPDQTKNILTKCFCIATEILQLEDTLSFNLRNLKENLIVHHLESEDDELKHAAIRALLLYCLLDLTEAQKEWDLFESAINIEPSETKEVMLKCVFDLLTTHGFKLFSENEEDGEKELEKFAGSLLSDMHDGEQERDIIVRGVLNVYTAKYLKAPTLLASCCMLYFDTDSSHSLKQVIEKFLQTYGETKCEAQCLIQCFLKIVNAVYNLKDEDTWSETNLKSVTQRLLEFSKRLENSEAYVLEEKFSDLLVIKLTTKYLKKPQRLPSTELYQICNQIVPHNIDHLTTLEENVKQIIQNLNMSRSKQRTTYSVRTTKQFEGYLKKLTIALSAAEEKHSSTSLTEASPLEKRLFQTSIKTSEGSSPSSREDNISVDASPAREKSFLNDTVFSHKDTLIFDSSPETVSSLKPQSLSKGSMISVNNSLSLVFEDSNTSSSFNISNPDS